MTSLDLELDAAGTLPPGAFGPLASLAEQRGFDGIWKGETNNHDAIVLLSAAAAATRQITIGSAILHVLARSPVAAGMMAATLNELAGGRFILGLGVANATLAAWHGGRWEHPVEMLREYVDIVRATYTGDRVSVAGEVFSARDFRLGGARPTWPLQIWLAALGPAMSRLAGTIADGVLINLADPAAIAQIVGWVREGAISAGRDPSTIEIAAKVRVAISDDLGAARETLRPTVAIYTRARGYRELLERSGFRDELNAIEAGWKSGGFAGASRAISDAMLDRLPTLALTDPAELTARLAPYFAAGVTRIIIAFIPVGPDVVGETTRFVERWKERET